MPSAGRAFPWSDWESSLTLVARSLRLHSLCSNTHGLGKEQARRAAELRSDQREWIHFPEITFPNARFSLDQLAHLLDFHISLDDRQTCSQLWMIIGWEPPDTYLETDHSTWFAGAHSVSIVRDQLPAYWHSSCPAFPAIPPLLPFPFFPPRRISSAGTRIVQT